MLWPAGVTSIDDVPWDLAEAVAQAHRILDWYENCMEDDIPPQHLWPFSDEVNDWFQEVKGRKQQERDDRASPDDMSKLTSNDDPRLKDIKRR